MNVEDSYILGCYAPSSSYKLPTFRWKYCQVQIEAAQEYHTSLAAWRYRRRDYDLSNVGSCVLVVTA